MLITTDPKAKGGDNDNNDNIDNIGNNFVSISDPSYKLQQEIEINLKINNNDKNFYLIATTNWVVVVVVVVHR